MTSQEAVEMLVSKFPWNVNAEFSRDEDWHLDIDTASILNDVFSSVEIASMSDDTIDLLNEMIIAKTEIE